MRCPCYSPPYGNCQARKRGDCGAPTGQADPGEPGRSTAIRSQFRERVDFPLRYASARRKRVCKVRGASSQVQRLRAQGPPRLGAIRDPFKSRSFVDVLAGPLSCGGALLSHVAWASGLQDDHNFVSGSIFRCDVPTQSGGVFPRPAAAPSTPAGPGPAKKGTSSDANWQWRSWRVRPTGKRCPGLSLLEAN